MLYEPIEAEQVGSFTVEIYRDDDPMSPRDWDNVGRFCGLNDWTFNDHPAGNPGHAYREARAGGPILALPIYVVDGPYSIIRECNWDQAEGIYWAALAEVLSTGYCTVDELRTAMRAELSEMNRYLAGDVYGYTVTGPGGEPLDSCWGFIGDYDYALSEGRGTARHMLRNTPAWVLAQMEAWADDSWIKED